ncbi:MAG: hypothetical protein WCX69_02510 [Candidatus Paceibacterota bacterium]
MLAKFILGGMLAAGISFFGGAEFVAAQEEAEEKEAVAAESSGSGEAAGAAGGVEAGAAGAGSSVVPAEIQQQLDGAQKTVDTAAKQIQSVKEKGLVQTVWDNITAPFTAVFAQISQILGSAFSLFGAK